MESGSGHIPNRTASLDTNTTDPSAFQPVVLAIIPTVIQFLLCCIVLRVFYLVPSLRTVSNLPIINLIASDILRSVTTFIALSVYADPLTTSPSTGDLALCEAFHYINHAQFAWSSWAIAIISYSRSDVILNALTPKFNKRKFWIFAVTTWSVSLLTALPPLVGWSSFGFKKRENSSFRRCLVGVAGKGLAHAVYVPLFFVVNFLVPFALVIVCMFRVVRVTKHYSRAHSSPSGRRHLNVVVMPTNDYLQTGKHLKREKYTRTVRKRIKETIKSKAFRYVVIIITSTLLLLAPYVIVRSYDAACLEMGSDKCIPDIGYEVTTMLFVVSFNVNAFLYVFWIRTFQKATIALCCRQKQTASRPAVESVDLDHA